MNLLSYQRTSEHRGAPRVWIESRRLEPLGFTPGTSLTIEATADGIRIRPAVSNGPRLCEPQHTVSKRRHKTSSTPFSPDSSTTSGSFRDWTTPSTHPTSQKKPINPTSRQPNTNDHRSHP